MNREIGGKSRQFWCAVLCNGQADSVLAYGSKNVVLHCQVMVESREPDSAKTRVLRVWRINTGVGGSIREGRSVKELRKIDLGTDLSLELYPTAVPSLPSTSVTIRQAQKLDLAPDVEYIVE